MRYLLLAMLAIGLAPVWAEAGSRNSGWSVSVGFAYSEGYGYRSSDYFDARVTYSEGYKHGRGVSYHPPRVHVQERYRHREPVICRPPVIYKAPPVIYQAPPVVYHPPVVIYQPTYRPYDCYPNYGTYYRSTTYYYRY